MSKSILTPIPLTPCHFIGQSDVLTRRKSLANYSKNVKESLLIHTVVSHSKQYSLIFR